MSVTRTRLHFERDFVQIPNAWMRDTRLSRRARGLLAEIMTHSEGWVITTQSLMDSGKEGRDAIRAAIGELARFGYLERVRLYTDGRLAGSTYVLTDPDQRDGFPEPLQTRPPENRPTKNTITKEHQEEEEAPALDFDTEQATDEERSNDERSWAVASIAAGLGVQPRLLSSAEVAKLRARFDAFPGLDAAAVVGFAVDEPAPDHVKSPFALVGYRLGRALELAHREQLAAQLGG